MTFDLLFFKYSEFIQSKKKKMPFVAKLAFVCFVLMLLSINALFLIYIFTTIWQYLIGFFGLLTTFLLFLFLLSIKNKNQQICFDKELNESQNYLNELSNLLLELGVNIQNKAVLDILIDEAKIRQNDNFTIGFTKSTAMMSSLYYLIVTLACKALYDKYGFWKLIIFLIFSVVFFFVITVFFQYVKSFTARYIDTKRKKFNKFVEDINRIKFFYSFS